MIEKQEFFGSPEVLARSPEITSHSATVTRSNLYMSIDNNAIKQIHDLVLSLIAGSSEERKVILRDLIMRCTSSHGTCLLLIKEHLIEKIVTIWKEEEDMETKVLCGMVINTVGAFNNTTASSHTLISGLLALASSKEKEIMEVGTTELCLLIETISEKKEEEESIGLILGWTIGTLHSQRPLNNQSEELIWKYKVCNAIKIVTSILKGGVAKPVLLWPIQECIVRLNEDKDIDINYLANGFILIWRRQGIENERLIEAQHTIQREISDRENYEKSSIWEAFGKTLWKNVNENDVYEKQDKRDVIFSLIQQILENKQNDQERGRAIECEEFIGGLLHHLSQIPLDKITRKMSSIFFFLTHPTSNEIRQLLYTKKPFSVLVRLLDHTNQYIVGDSGGTNITLRTQQHPHFDSMNACRGIEKIYSLFKKNVSKYSKDTSALAIGLLYRSKEIVDQQIKIDIISHIKTLVDDKDDWTLKISRLTLSGLAQNEVNRAEIEKGWFKIPD
ncbi:MAG: hypothetical protein EZS28_010854 [Streblomastix strix]|uniref:Uncharacterized protein n=1 Tax=Streblomastix strix TaxID=222440 RepID=A0A5J4WF87_9EUKA|nr:MAG: hypothetical protein EZS28_010854 [Streblomastix strix]